MSDKYTFKHWMSHHGYSQGSGDFIEVGKRAVWEQLKNDPEFFKMKLFEIKVKQVNNYYPGANTYTWPGQITTYTEKHWCKTLADARKIGEVTRQLYPDATEIRKRVKPASERKTSKKASSK